MILWGIDIDLAFECHTLSVLLEDVIFGVYAALLKM